MNNFRVKSQIKERTLINSKSNTGLSPNNKAVYSGFPHERSVPRPNNKMPYSGLSQQSNHLVINHTNQSLIDSKNNGRAKFTQGSYVPYIHNKITNPVSFQNDTEKNRITRNMEENGWVTINRKINKKVTQEVKPEVEKLEKVQNSPGSINNSEKEKKKQMQLLKNQKIKEEKMRKREEKAKQIRENSRRDTKVTVISQDAVNSIFRNSSYQNPQMSLQKHSMNTFFEDFPTWPANSKPYKSKMSDFTPVKSNTEHTHTNFKNVYVPKYIRKASSTAPIHENTNDNTKAVPEISLDQRKSSNIKFVNCSSFNKKSKIKAVSSTAFVQSHKEKWNGKPAGNLSVPQKEIFMESPTKKSVKSKDLININLMDLIKSKQQDDGRGKTLRKKEVPNIPPNVAEKRSKITEGKVKKLTPLQKNVLRQKKAQAELLNAILTGLQVKQSDTPKCQENTDSECNKTAKFEGISQEGKEAIEVKPSEGSTPPARPKPEPAPADDSGVSSAPNVNPEAHKLLLREMQNLMNPVHNSKFREYCYHVVTPEIDQLLKEMISLLVMFQERLYHQDPVKGRTRRRYYCGLREAFRHHRRSCCVVMAPNLKPSPGKGCLDELVGRVLDACNEAGVPVIFGLTHRRLGQLCHRKVPVCCLTIINIQGTQEKFYQILELLPEAKKQYEVLLQKHSLNPYIEDDQPSVEKEKSDSERVTDSLLEVLRK